MPSLRNIKNPKLRRAAVIVLAPVVVVLVMFCETFQGVVDLCQYELKGEAQEIWGLIVETWKGDS